MNAGISLGDRQGTKGIGLGLDPLWKIDLKPCVSEVGRFRRMTSIPSLCSPMLCMTSVRHHKELVPAISHFEIASRKEPGKDRGLTGIAVLVVAWV